MEPEPPRGERRADNEALHKLMEGLAEEADTLVQIRKDYTKFAEDLEKRHAEFEECVWERLGSISKKLTRMVTIVAAACVLALAGLGYVIDQQGNIQTEQVAGRRFAINALCGATSGVINAGRSIIIAGARTPEQRIRARLIAVTYARQIAQSAAREVKVRSIVNPDGTLNCAVLRQKSAANP